MNPSGMTFADVSTFSALFQHILRKKIGNNVTWRHMTSPENFAKIFPFIISYFCENLKLIGWYLPKLWQLTFFFSLMWRYRGKRYFPKNLTIWPGITFEPLIVKKSLNPRWKALTSFFTRKSIWNLCGFIFAYVSNFWP